MPGIVIGDLFLGDYSTPLGTVLAQTIGNTVALVVAAALLRRLTHGRTGLDRVADVLAFIACALVAALISAAFGPMALRLGGVIPTNELGEVFRTWTLGDAAGVLVVAPALLTWATASARGMRRPSSSRPAVLLVVLVLLADLPPQRDVPYVVFPALLWAALRFGPRGAATATLIVCSITVWNTAQNSGPFVRDSLTDSLLSTQLFIATAAITSLLLAAVTAERIRAARALAADRGGAARARRRAGSAPPRRHARRERRAAEPRVRAGHRGGRAGCSGSPARTSCTTTACARATVVGAWSDDGPPRFPVGAHLDVDGDTVVARVVRTGKPRASTTCRPAANWRRRSGAPATGPRSRHRSSSAAGSGACWPRRATRRIRSPDGIELRLNDFAELVAQALANADAYEKLAASRARLVEVGDAERRRLERNLHDGAQQRLVSVALGLGMVSSRLESDPAAARELLANAQAELTRGLDELRELARGIHPAVLTERGLGPALDALAARAPVPVELAAMPDERLAAPVEAAMYYVVAESITNVAKYAHAAGVTVSIDRSNGAATVVVADDGVGGADPAGGSGLRGLAARVEALNGRLDVASPPGGGTRITAEIPVGEQLHTDRG